MNMTPNIRIEQERWVNNPLPFLEPTVVTAVQELTLNQGNECRDQALYSRFQNVLKAADPDAPIPGLALTLLQQIRNASLAEIDNFSPDYVIYSYERVIDFLKMKTSPSTESAKQLSKLIIHIGEIKKITDGVIPSLQYIKEAFSNIADVWCDAEKQPQKSTDHSNNLSAQILSSPVDFLADLILNSNFNKGCYEKLAGQMPPLKANLEIEWATRSIKSIVNKPETNEDKEVRIQLLFNTLVKYQTSVEDCREERILINLKMKQIREELNKNGFLKRNTPHSPFLFLITGRKS